MTEREREIIYPPIAVGLGEQEESVSGNFWILSHFAKLPMAATLLAM